MAVSTNTSSSQLFSSFLRFDSEFFRPEYVEIANRINSISRLTNLGLISQRITQGSNPSFSVSGLACVNGKNVYFGTMTEGNPNFVSDTEFKRLSGFRLRRNDLVVTLKHATKVGRVWIVEDDEPRIFSRNIGLIRLRGDSPIRPSVLLLYLWTKQGQFLLDRCATGGTTGQITLPMSELRGLPIPLFEDKAQREIEEIFLRSRESGRRSQEAFSNARQLLGSELRLDELMSERPIGYQTSFSELELSNRFDPQHYQPRFMRLRDHLSQFPVRRIRDIRYLNRRGLQPIYVKDGTHAVVNSQHIGPKHINYDGLERTTEKLFNAAPEAHIRKDDLLIYTTGAYIGRTNVYLDDTPAFASNHVNILRLSPDIDHAYMAMVFQSIIGQFQTQKHARGSAQAELYPTDIDKFIVPLLPIEMQQEIGNLVRESLAQQRESARLLEQAKARVEKLIEEAVAA